MIPSSDESHEVDIAKHSISFEDYPPVFPTYLFIGAKDDVGRERRRASLAGSSFSHRDNSVRIGVPGLKVRILEKVRMLETAQSLLKCQG